MIVDCQHFILAKSCSKSEKKHARLAFTYDGLLVQKQPSQVFCKESKAGNFIEKETLAQVFPSEFCEISKNIFST